MATKISLKTIRTPEVIFDINAASTAVPTRVFKPEKPDTDEQDTEEHDTEERDNDEQDTEEQDNEDLDEAETKVKTRKPRTKKTYPPSEKMFEELIGLMCEMRDTTRKIVSLARETQKCVAREQKEHKIQTRRLKAEKPVSKPRGFAVPSPISSDMVNYLTNEAKITNVERKVGDSQTLNIRIEPGCSLARNELTAALCQHFKNSGMRKSTNDKRDIHLDAKTARLFGIDSKKWVEEGGRVSASGEPIITYFDLQKYLPRHCGKQRSS